MSQRPQEDTQHQSLCVCCCSHCPQEIEFERSRSGETVNCPGCGGPTVLRTLPPILPLPQVEKKPTTDRSKDARVAARLDEISARNRKRPVGAWQVVLFALIGVCLVFVGCSGELDESTKDTGSAIRQAVYAVQYGAGFIILGLSAILQVLRRIYNETLSAQKD